MFIYYKTKNIKRIFVRFIDFVFFSVFTLIILAIFDIKSINIHKIVDTSFLYDKHNPWNFNISLVCLLILYFLYFLICPYFFEGKTFAKYLFKLKIVDNDTHRNLQFTKVFKRELFISFYFVVIISIYFLVGNIYKAYSFQGLEQTNYNHFITLLINWLSFFFSSALLFFSLILLFSKTNTGIQDIMARSMVINCKKEILLPEFNMNKQSINSQKSLIIEEKNIKTDD